MLLRSRGLRKVRVPASFQKGMLCLQIPVGGSRDLPQGQRGGVARFLRRWRTGSVLRPYRHARHESRCDGESRQRDAHVAERAAQQLRLSHVPQPHGRQVRTPPHARPLALTQASVVLCLVQTLCVNVWFMDWAYCGLSAPQRRADGGGGGTWWYVGVPVASPSGTLRKPVCECCAAVALQ